MRGSPVVDRVAEPSTGASGSVIINMEYCAQVPLISGPLCVQLGWIANSHKAEPPGHAVLVQAVPLLLLLHQVAEETT